MSATILDLHGRRMEQAISEVTLFLERIRRTVANSSRGRGRHNILYVTIITGSGSHSTHGPILKNAVQRLLEKRGMNWSLERGGGAFKVDALSGVDLYDKVAPTCGKVVVAEQTEFHQMAASRRRMNGGSYASTMAHHPGPPVRTVSVPKSITSPLINRRSGPVAPLPRHVALEDAAIQKATKQSVTELQLKQNMNDRLSKEYEREFQKAVSESKLQCAIEEKEEGEEGWEAQQLRLACEQSLRAASKAEKLAEQENYEDDDELRKAYESLIEAEEREQDDDKSDETEDYESKQLRLAYEQSLKEAKEKHIYEEDEEEEQLRRAYELSIQEKQQSSFDDAEQLKIAYESSLKEEQRRQQMTEKQYEDALIRAMEQSTKEAEANNRDRNSSEDDLLERALAESKAFAEKTRDSDLEMLERALQESMFYEENRKCYQEQEALATSQAVDLLDVAKTLSLKQQEEEALAEEEALKKVIAESMR